MQVPACGSAGPISRQSTFWGILPLFPYLLVPPCFFFFFIPLLFRVIVSLTHNRVQVHMSSINASRSQRLSQPNAGKQTEFIAFGAFYRRTRVARPPESTIFFVGRRLQHVSRTVCLRLFRWLSPISELQSMTEFWKRCSGSVTVVKVIVTVVSWISKEAI